MVVNEITGPDTATCSEIKADRVSGPVMELGEWLISISRAGFDAGECSQVSVYHNGVELNVFGNDPAITPANADDEYAKRSIHDHLELQTGDVLAFRFKQSSYYCYNGLSDFVVNGNPLASTNNSVTTHYSLKYTAGWNLPSFVPTYVTQETGSNPGDFIPLRTNMIAGSIIVPGSDLWAADNGSPDTHRSNYYFRIVL